MAKVFIEESTLTKIGNSIRNKTGKTDLIDPAVMDVEIDSIVSGGGELPEEAFLITGDGVYKFSGSGWNWFLNIFGDRLTTKNMTNLNHMFYYNAEITEIPFQINLTEATSLNNMFNAARRLATAPVIRGTFKWNTSTDLANLFSSCDYIRNLDGVFTSEMLEGFSNIQITNAYSCPKTNNLFSYNYSLRKVPDWFYYFKLNEASTVFPSYSSGLFYYTFSNCAVLDEILNIPVWRCTGAQTNNMFNYFVSSCTRLANFTFETQADGTPYEVKWKSQTIDLSQSIGYASSDTNILNYNSGITIDSEVWNDESYQARKNDPNWYGRSVEYSRYNLESAIATINSLPDTSAYLATAGGTNTIKFKKNSGLNTDGGGITADTMAEASALAFSKGWTVAIA